MTDRFHGDNKLVGFPTWPHLPPTVGLGDVSSSPRSEPSALARAEPLAGGYCCSQEQPVQSPVEKT